MGHTESEVRALPKVELHVHLEDTIARQRLTDLARDADQTPPFPFDKPFRFSGLADFLEFLDWSCRPISALTRPTRSLLEGRLAAGFSVEVVGPYAIGLLIVR